MLAKLGLRRSACVLAAIAAVAVFGFLTLVLPRWRTEDDIRDAVFRYQMRHNASALQQKTGAFYLSINTLGFDRSPSDGFIARFRGCKPPVRGVACCIAEADGVRDRRTGDKGIVLRVGRIRWVSSTEVDVDGGYFEGGVSASGNTYRVVKRGLRWVVVKNTMLWIS